MAKINVDRLRQLSESIERQQEEFVDVLQVEPAVARHLNEAQSITAKRYREVTGEWPKPPTPQEG